MKFIPGFVCQTLALLNLVAGTGVASEASPGLKLTLRPLEGTAVDSRVARLVAICVPEGQPVSPFLSPGPFEAVWEGDLNMKLNDSFVFSAEGRGSLKVEVAGKVVLQIDGPDLHGPTSPEISLRKGPNLIRVTYRSLTEGEALMRLYWWNPTIPREPIPPEVFTHATDDPVLKHGLALREGRWQFAVGRCIRCHHPTSSLPTGAMPELQLDAPDLTELAARVKPGWVMAWLRDPAAFPVKGTMPAMLHGSADQVARDARDLTAFLFQKTTSPDSRERNPQLARTLTDPDLIDQGDALYQTLGCMTCHVFSDDPPIPDDTRLKLDHVAAKWRPSGLIEFLQDPPKRYQWIRMPHFALKPDEARALAAYVVSRCPPDALAEAPAEEGNAQRGRERAVALRCVACHTIPDLPKAFQAPSLEQVARTAAKSLRGCLAKEVPGDLPAYPFSDTTRRAIQSFLNSALPSLQRTVWPEFANRQVEALRCFACHARDTRGAVWDLFKSPATKESNPYDDGGGESDAFTEFGEESAEEVEPTNINAIRPPLTWAGEKLRVAWMEPFIAGTLPYKPRPRLKERMPGFPAYAHGLAVGFALDHGFPVEDPPEPPPNEQLAAIGRHLVQADRLGCWSCHAIGDKGALSGPSNEAINLKFATLRLRRHYYNRYVLDPKRVLPGTMMPMFVDETGHTAIQDVLGGDAQRQFDALWQFMRLLAEGKIGP